MNEMGEIDSNDIYQSFRKYDVRMLPWIENILEGESAFDNKEKTRIPHRIIDGEIVYNTNKNGDKYTRCHWDKISPCVHTRNDILASQNTIHPNQNRVFSVRELMRMMSIPDSFVWTEIKSSDLNSMSFEEKQKYLNKNEMNIRQCLGEAVPTEVFRSIAKKIKKSSNPETLSLQKINKLVEKERLDSVSHLREFIIKNHKILRLETLFDIVELSNSKRTTNAAYFTRKDISFTLIKDLPKFKNKKSIRILEPSVGIGRFIPQLAFYYKDKDKVSIDVVDIDGDSLEIMNLILSLHKLPKNIAINPIHGDFLMLDLKGKYDVVIGNPPYMKIRGKKELLNFYKFDKINTDTNNIFSFFIEKCMTLGNYISLIVPKSLINTPEFNKTRALLLESDITKICDYGEKGFRGVKIETIGICLDMNKKKIQKDVIIESYIRNCYQKVKKSYVFSENYPFWLLYRNKEFDAVASKLTFNIFQAFRDRQITKKNTLEKGKIRVLKSRNIGSNHIINLSGYDCYVNDANNFAVSKYLNQKDVVAVPNLSYYPRASFLPKNCIADGSVALLTLKNGSRKPDIKDLEFYHSKEFESFYRVARNYGTRSLNIDNNSVFFFGLLK